MKAADLAAALREAEAEAVDAILAARDPERTAEHSQRHADLTAHRLRELRQRAAAIRERIEQQRRELDRIKLEAGNLEGPAEANAAAAAGDQEAAAAAVDRRRRSVADFLAAGGDPRSLVAAVERRFLEPIERAGREARTAGARGSGAGQHGLNSVILAKNRAAEIVGQALQEAGSEAA